MFKYESIYSSSIVIPKIFKSVRSSWDNLCNVSLSISILIRFNGNWSWRVLCFRYAYSFKYSHWNAHTEDHFSFFLLQWGKYSRTMWFYDQEILIIWRLQINTTIFLAPLDKLLDEKSENKTHGTCGWTFGLSILVLFSSFWTISTMISEVFFIFLYFSLAFFPCFWGFLNSCSIVRILYVVC